MNQRERIPYPVNGIASQRMPLVSGTRVCAFRSMSCNGNCRNQSIPCHQTEHASRTVASLRTTLRTVQFNFNASFQALPSAFQTAAFGSD